MKEQISLTLMVVASVFFFDVDRSRAGLVTWEFAGEVTEVFDSQRLVEGIVDVGSPFSASVTFDAGTPDELPDDPARGDYRSPVNALSGAIGGLDYFQTGMFGGITVFDEFFGSDAFIVTAGNVTTPTFAEPADLRLSVNDSTRTMFNDDSLPVIPPTGFDSGRFQLQNASESVVLRGDITSIVPEPTTLVLLLGGAMPLFITRGRRRNGVAAALLLIFALSASPPASGAAWNGGPVLIGGDDTDDHFEDAVGDPMGRIYMREGFDFLGPLVGNGNTMAVCVGCDEDMEAEDNFQQAFADSTLPGLGWTQTSVNGDMAINAFFANTGTVNIEDTGIIHMPSALQVEGGLDEDEVEAINNNRAVLRSFVKDDRGGLFTHAITGLPETAGGTEPYLWLEELVPGIVVLERTANDLNLTCTAKGAFFPELTSEEIEAIEGTPTSVGMTPWHAYFEGSFGGLSVVAQSDAPQNDVIILGGPLPGLDCNQNAVLDGCELSGNDANRNGILDECEIAGGTTCDLDDNGVPDEAAACCDGQGGCVNTMPDFCVSGGGTPYFGATCLDCTCGVNGGCCLGMACEVLPECECVARGGAFIGAGVTCLDQCETGVCCAGAEACFNPPCGSGEIYVPLAEDCAPNPCTSIPQFTFCPEAIFNPATDTDPQSGTKDARQPHPRNDNSFAARQGIGSPNTYAGGPDALAQPPWRPLSTQLRPHGGRGTYTKAPTTAPCDMGLT